MTIKPLFGEIVRSAPRPLGGLLPAVDNEPAISPWTPAGASPIEAAPAAPLAPAVRIASPGSTGPRSTPEGSAESINTDAIRAEARQQGLAEGLRETEALRARLTQLIAALSAAHDAIAAPSADLIAEAAACVVGAWVGSADHKQLFAPIIRGWLARAASEPATARVHPSDVAAVAELAGESRLAVVGDASIAPGDIRIRGAALELACAWTDRLGELRRMIAEALA